MKSRPSRLKTRPEAVDESAESEIVIHPDGRVYAFGITLGVAEVLASVSRDDSPARKLVRRIVAARSAGGIGHE